MNISSIVVKTSPENEDSVIADLESSGLCDVHFHDGAGKIIVTLEGDDITEEVRKMKAIMDLPGVLSADLAYACSDSGEGQGTSGGSMHGSVPEVLRDA